MGVFIEYLPHTAVHTIARGQSSNIYCDSRCGKVNLEALRDLSVVSVLGVTRIIQTEEHSLVLNFTDSLVYPLYPLHLEHKTKL